MVSLLQALCVILTVSQVNVWGLRCYFDGDYAFVLDNDPKQRPQKGIRKCKDEYITCFTLTGYDTQRNTYFMIAGCGLADFCRQLENSLNAQYPVTKTKCVKECSTDECNYQSAMAAAPTTEQNHKSTHDKSAAVIVYYSIGLVLLTCLFYLIK